MNAVPQGHASIPHSIGDKIMRSVDLQVINVFCLLPNAGKEDDPGSRIAALQTKIFGYNGIPAIESRVIRSDLRTGEMSGKAHNNEGETYLARKRRVEFLHTQNLIDKGIKLPLGS